MKITYRTKGVCSSEIELEMDGDIIRAVSFRNGCNGNLQGIGNLVAGMRAEDVIRKLQGVQCGRKATSCPDQLAAALREWLTQNGGVSV